MTSKDDYSDFSRALETALREQVFDQELALKTLTKTLLQKYLLKKDSPFRALFTFIGPPNSGKHYLARVLLEADTNITKLKTFNMSQYESFYSPNEQFSIKSIEQEVQEFVQENPNSILFFEDIEKADLQVQLSLYSLFTCKEKKQADFSNVIIIMSTTRLSSLLQRPDIHKLLEEDYLQAHTFIFERLALEKISINTEEEYAFEKKFLSFLNEHTLIVFNKLSLETLIKIGARALHKTSQAFTKQSSIEIEYQDIQTFVSSLTLSLSPYLNPKHIQQKLPEVLFNQIYEILNQDKNIKHITCKAEDASKAFLAEIFSDQNAFIEKVRKQHQRVYLNWDRKIIEGYATLSIKDAYFAEEKLSITSEEDIKTSNVTFKDIAGHKRVKEELKEIINLFKKPSRVKKFGMSLPKGMFLCGPEGVGKKLLSRAFAHEMHMPYIVINNSDLFSETKIRKAYEKAYDFAPAIIILENIDIQGLMGSIISTMNVTPLMDILDNLSQSFDAPVFTIATLNDVKNIPEQLMLTGRIDIRIEVPKLDIEARRFFIKDVLKKPHQKNIDIERIIRYTSGMNGNELKRISQEAALYAARKGLQEITEEIILEQINVIKYGAKLESKQIKDIEISMKKTAYHEAGHAVLSSILMPHINIEQVTVSPRSDALGFVSYKHEDYIDAVSKEKIFYNICVLFAGRVAKMEKFGEDGMETGAMSDLDVATIQAYSAIALFGMDEELGYINISALEMEFQKEILSEKIEERLLVWIKNAQIETQKRVKEYWGAIEAVAKVLIKKEVIEADELKELIKNNL